MLWQIPLAAQMHSLQSAFNILPARPALSTCPSRCWWSCWNSTALHQLRAWSMTTSYLLRQKSLDLMRSNGTGQRHWCRCAIPCRCSTHTRASMPV